MKNKDIKEKKVSYHRKPDSMTVDEWQIALRKQFAKTQHFVVKNIGDSEVFSDYSVANYHTQNTYKVAIRGKEPGKNFCSCLDFKTNLLGTCKHIEYVLLQIAKSVRKSKLLDKGFVPHYTSIYLSYGKEIQVKIRIGTEKKDEFETLARTYFDNNHTLKESAYKTVDGFLQKAFSLHPDFRCYPDALQHIIEYREKERQNKKIDEALANEDDFFKSVIRADLFPYQKEGVEFALRKGRCLIADDMGLGKTIQAIAAAEGMKKLFGISKVLIVCPTSLKYQWKTEIERFTQSEVCVVEGTILAREEQYANDVFYKICSYNVVGRDIKNINQNDFDLVILDEAQRIKNWKTKTAESVKKVQSKYCIVLTGTPLENKLEELYSVVQMVNPLILGALFRFVSAHQITEPDTDKVIGYRDLDKIAVLLKDILIRRHKSKVLKQLPERMDKNLFVPMTPKQLDYYDEAYDNVARLVHKWSRFRFLSEKDRQALLINLNMMRMACNSTFIIDQKTRHDTKIEELMSILDEVLENTEEKVVVFSQWERMTRIVAQELDKKDIGYESLHGGVPSKDRGALFDNFRNNPKKRVFLSTDAGGVGLNLQSASLLINLDLPWNPAVLEQRIARIYRMGQKKNVQIINLIARNTIEEEMLSKLKFKSSIAAGILDNGESSVFLKESKFNKLMKEVKELTENTSKPEVTEKEEEFKEISKSQKELCDLQTEEEQTGESVIEKQLELFDGEKQSKPSEAQSSAQDLLESGTDFVGKLLHTLSDKEKTEELMNTLVKKDTKSGKTYLQIPVKDEEVIQTGLKMLGQLLAGFSK